jgi:hypothetical protein
VKYIVTLECVQKLLGSLELTLEELNGFSDHVLDAIENSFVHVLINRTERPLTIDELMGISTFVSKSLCSVVVQKLMEREIEPLTIDDLLTFSEPAHIALQSPYISDLIEYGLLEITELAHLTAVTSAVLIKYAEALLGSVNILKEYEGYPEVVSIKDGRVDIKRLCSEATKALKNPGIHALIKKRQGPPYTSYSWTLEAILELSLKSSDSMVLCNPIISYLYLTHSHKATSITLDLYPKKPLFSSGPRPVAPSSKVIFGKYELTKETIFLQLREDILSIIRVGFDAAPVAGAGSGFSASAEHGSLPGMARLFSVYTTAVNTAGATLG